MPTWSVQIVSKKLSISILYKDKLILKALFRVSVFKKKITQLKKDVLWQKRLSREETSVAF